jgi:hypothetical protein
MESKHGAVKAIYAMKKDGVSEIPNIVEETKAICAIIMMETTRGSSRHHVADVDDVTIAIRWTKPDEQSMPGEWDYFVEYGPMYSIFTELFSLHSNVSFEQSWAMLALDGHLDPAKARPKMEKAYAAYQSAIRRKTVAHVKHLAAHEAFNAARVAYLEASDSINELKDADPDSLPLFMQKLQVSGTNHLEQTKAKFEEATRAFTESGNALKAELAPLPTRAAQCVQSSHLPAEPCDPECAQPSE